jgi:CelD/BcsL family acetyltransferase involved in cellulose biosynthesis
MNTLKVSAVPFNLAHLHDRADAAQKPASLPAGCIVSIVQGVPALSGLAAEWHALAQETANRISVFQTFSWLSQWSRHFAGEVHQSRVFAVVGYDAGRLVFVWPLMEQRKHGLTTIQWLSFPSGQYGDVLLANGYCPHVWQNAALSLLKRARHADILHLRHVRHGTSFQTFAQESFYPAHNEDRAPFMDLTLFKTEQDYENRYNSSQRRRRKKIRKELEEIGAVEFNRVAPGAATDQAIALAIAEKNQWLSARGRINRILNCPKHLAFLQALARSSDGGVETVVTEMTCGGKPVSWEIAFRFNDTHFGYITSHVNTLTDRSPGRLHMHYSQIMALKDGMQRFDLMVPHDAHKESWATGMVETNDYFLPLSLRGKIMGQLYLSALRPLLSKAYYRLPPNLLKALSPLTSKLI